MDMDADIIDITKFLPKDNDDDEEEAEVTKCKLYFCKKVEYDLTKEVHLEALFEDYKAEFEELNDDIEFYVEVLETLLKRQIVQAKKLRDLELLM
jgi:hypothetical protein